MAAFDDALRKLDAVMRRFDVMIQHRKDARTASTRAMQEALLRNEWKRNGPDLDYDDVWSDFVKEAKIWNHSHDTRQHVDVDRYRSGSVPQFEREFEAKYLNGKTKPWPGVKKANQWFMDHNSNRAVFLSKEEARAAGED